MRRAFFANVLKEPGSQKYIFGS